MKCARCNRPLIRYAVSVDTKDGPIGWGPDCARKVFKAAKRERKAQPVRDERTVDWVEVMR